MRTWILYGIIRTILIVIIMLAHKYDNSCKGYAWPILVHIVSSILLLFYALIYEKKDNFINANIYIIILVSILIFAIVFLSHDIIKKAPNVAYLRIFSAIEIILLLVLSYYLFDEKINMKMIIGFIFIILGVIVLTI